HTSTAAPPSTAGTNAPSANMRRANRPTRRATTVVETVQPPPVPANTSSSKPAGSASSAPRREPARDAYSTTAIVTSDGTAPRNANSGTTTVCKNARSVVQPNTGQ